MIAPKGFASIILPSLVLLVLSATPCSASFGLRQDVNRQKYPLKIRDSKAEEWTTKNCSKRETFHDKYHTMRTATAISRGGDGNGKKKTPGPLRSSQNGIIPMLPTSLNHMTYLFMVGICVGGGFTISSVLFICLSEMLGDLAVVVLYGLLSVGLLWISLADS